MSLITVVIPTYNRAALLVRAVNSALASCIAGDEILVVDDGSSDGTAQVLAPYRGRVQHIVLPRGGAGRARNHGIEIACHPLIAFLDSDDEWIPGYLEAKRRLLNARPELLYCFSDFAVRTASGESDRFGLRLWHETPPDWELICGPCVKLSSAIEMPYGVEDAGVYAGDLYRQEMIRNCVLTSTLVVRKDRAGTTLRFAEDLPTCEDWECYGRVAKCGPGAFLSCETAWQHGHAGPRLTDANKLIDAAARIAVLQRVWGADPKFLAKHGAEYERVLRKQQFIRIRALLRAGRTAEARELMRQIGHVPLSWRVLASMPAGLSEILVRGRTALRKMLRAA
jgi:glycosyltransferase involved in cell wall biosynthesis